LVAFFVLTKSASEDDGKTHDFPTNGPKHTFIYPLLLNLSVPTLPGTKQKAIEVNAERKIKYGCTLLSLLAFAELHSADVYLLFTFYITLI